MSARPSKILLITDVPPNSKYSGGLLTLRLAERLAPNQIHGFYIVSDGLKDVKSELSHEVEQSSEYHRKPPEMSMRALGKIWHRLSFLGAAVREFYRKYWECWLLKRKVESAVHRRGIDKIWIVMQGQTLIWLTHALIKSNKVPVHVQYWDSPGWWIRANLIDRISRRFVWRSFHYCLANSKRAATPSYSASEIAWKDDGRQTFPLVGLVSDDSPPVANGTSNGIIKIGIAGQLYAADTIRRLIRALESMEWKIDGKPVEIHYWGSSFDETIDPFLIRHGYVPQDELLIKLQKCDILYCPYWFDPRFRIECQTSFPSKLTTYLLLGKIVFFHGPPYSGPAKLLREYDAAVVCDSEMIEIVKYYLRVSIQDHAASERKIRNAKVLYNERLSREVVFSNFRKFLDV